MGLVPKALWAMMSLILATGSLRAAENYVPKRSSLGQAVIVSYPFERSGDLDFDHFPDNWTRKRDSQHPSYLPIKIVAHDEQLLEATRWIDRQTLDPWDSVRTRWPGLPPLPPSAVDWLVDHYLRFELDGGAAMLQSPAIKLDPNYRYQLSGRATTQGLVHNHAFGELVFFDAQGQSVAAYRAQPLVGSTFWESWRTELAAPPPTATTIAIRLHLAPILGGSDRDIRGAAGFDDLVVMQVPRVHVETDQRLSIYRPGERPVIKLQVMGLRQSRATARFVLKDSDGRVMEVAEKPFTYPGGNSAGSEALREKLARSQEGESSRASEEFAAVAQWALSPLPPGFYTVESSLTDRDQQWLQSETTLAVQADLPGTSQTGPFGWVLPHGAGDVDVKRLPDWLRRSGVNIVKYPFWIDPNDRAKLDAAAWLAERLKESEIRCVGLLALPPPSVQAILDERDQRQPVAANLFRDARVWQPLLEPIMTRLTMRVRTWQLGLDDDQSFVGRPQLPEVLTAINRDLQGYGQPIGVAVSWPWLEPLPAAVGGVVAAVGRSTEEPLTSHELDAYLQLAASELHPGTTHETWVSLDPLSSEQYDRDSRIRDLMLRMATVRGHSVSAAFVSDPYHSTQGLLHRDSRPAELFLPWRTTSLMLGDMVRIGEIGLEGDGANMVFANAHRTVLMLWSAKPSTEMIYLGDAVRQVDAWGRTTIPARIDSGPHAMHRLQLGPVPVFLVDVDPLVVAVRMATRLQNDRIDSLLGRRQTVNLMISNPTDERLSGSVLLKPPPDWQVESSPQSFNLLPRERTIVAFDVVLSNSARIGDSHLEFDVSLRTDPPKRFTLRRPIRVGPEGLDLEVTTKRAGDDLIVQLDLRNHSGEDRQYNCYLFPPEGRQYQRQQISVPTGAAVRREFVWEDAASLIGKSMLLRAVEGSGGRILNHSVTVTH